VRWRAFLSLRRRLTSPAATHPGANISSLSRLNRGQYRPNVTQSSIHMASSIDVIKITSESPLVALYSFYMPKSFTVTIHSIVTSKTSCYSHGNDSSHRCCRMDCNVHPSSWYLGPLLVFVSNSTSFVSGILADRKQQIDRLSYATSRRL